jgi:hydroxymethylglutaryl-CoA lyase
MADTKEVLEGLILTTETKLLAIVANVRGADEACKYDSITSLGFPFSISETFQKRNTNSSIIESFKTVEIIHEKCLVKGKQLVVYLSMAFGNPYGDEYSKEIVFNWAQRMASLAIPVISLADTVGLATPAQVRMLTDFLIEQLPAADIGVHLHSTPYNSKEKAEAALDAGCRRFDSALKGIGGCPMANDILVGNMDTENMIRLFQEKNLLRPLNIEALHKASLIANEIFEPVT